MSASLVGSEMCIRDRLVADPRTVCNRVCDRLLEFREGLIEQQTRADRACLLYTSDAADDM
eukprot:933651-Alexandrium_andersonii.AAC.1